MLGSLGELFVKVSADTSELEKGMKKAESGITGLGAAFQKHGKAIGAAMTVVGVGLTALIDSSMKTNAALGTTALQLGISTKEMRALAIETANVTFPLSEATASFDLLTRAGMENTDQIAVTAEAFDMLGDAIGKTATEVTGPMVTAMKTFGLEISEGADYVDQMTYLFRNTSLEMENFSGIIAKIPPDIVKMGLTMEDTIVLLGLMEEAGLSGEVATREFEKAVTIARNSGVSLNETLGFTNEQMDEYEEKLDGATGMAQQFADAQNKQYSTMDKLKHALSEATLSYGTMLEPLKALGPVMMGLGPIMMAMARVQWSTLIPTLTTHAAAAWAAIAPYLVIIAPILAVIGILAILEYKFGFVTKAIGLLSDAFGWIMGGLKSFLGITSDATGAAEDLALGVEEEARLMGTAEIAADALAEAQKRVADSAAEVDILTTAYEELQGAIADVLGLTEDVDDQARAVEHAMFGLEDAEKKYAEAVAEHGINSDEAARADLRRRDAVDRLDDAQKKQIKLTEELASADIKKQDILDDNNVENLEGFENLLHNKRAQQEHFGDDVIRLETELVDAQEGLAKHRADMEIAEQKRIETEVISSWGRITGALSGLAGTAYDAGVGLVTALANGIISGISAAVDAVKEAAATIMDYFPFSDAKKGPLSNITASGAALMTTFAHGMDHSGIDITGTMEQVLPRPATISPASPAGAVTTTNDNSSSSSSVSMGDVNLSGDYNFEALMQDINRYQSQQRTQRGVR